MSKEAIQTEPVLTDHKGRPLKFWGGKATESDCDEGTYNPLAQTSTYTCGVCGVSMQMEQPAQTSTYTCGVCDVSMQMEQPAQRPWIGLTHEDIVIILNNDYGGSRADCIRAAEAKLKERNT